MEVAIVKYNAGNVQSVTYALERLGVTPVVTDQPERLLGADKVIFPGVGEASTAMAYLRAQGLDKLLPALKQPMLGICLGLQLMCRHSEEGNVDCLGIFDVPVRRFPAGALKVPQMGWNNLEHMRGELFAGLPEDPYVYFVHSYYAELHEQYTHARTHYGLSFSASLHRDNFWAMQFHPEKSGAVGERILQNFLSL